MNFSIITVCYNSEKTIESTVQSVISQDYPHIEYIVIDGKSNDSTHAILSKYKNKISTLISEPDNGIYDAINKGIKLANGQIVGLLHSDDFFANEKVISTIAAAFSFHNADAIYSDLEYVSKEDVKKVVRFWKAGAYKTGDFQKGWMPPHPTFYARKELFEMYGGYNTAFKFSADYELMLRFIHKNSIKLGYIPEVLVKMRVGGEGNRNIKNRLLANKEDKMAWECNGLRPPTFLRIAKPLQKIKQYL